MALPRYITAEVSYQAGIAALAPYLDSSSLNAMSRINRMYFSIFGIYLWSDPIKFIVKMPRRPFRKTANFLLGKDRNDSFSLVQTLDLRPLTLPEIQRSDVNGYTQLEEFFSCERVFEHLHNFPNAKFIVVDGLPSNNNDFWDDGRLQHDAKILLLSVANSPVLNLTTVIRQNELVFSNLMYLDISGTRDTKGILYGPEIIELSNLRILKMRNMRLTTVPSFLIGLQSRLWSLDLRNNFLTDDAIQYLLESFTLKSIPQAEPPVFQAADHALYDSPPAYQEHGGELPTNICPLRPDSCDPVMEHMTNWKDEDSNPMYLQTGLTNLYISNNKCSSDVVRYLSYNNRLQAFDVGSVRKERDSLAYGFLLVGKSWATVQHIPSFQFKQPSRLERLRIHHSFITYIPTVLVDLDTGFHEPSLENSEVWGQGAKFDREPTYDPLKDFRLKRLTLTGVQTLSSTGLLIEHLIEFIRKITAQEQHIQQARAANPNPPRSAPPMLSGLRLLRLEFIREAGSAGSGSVSGDKDADTFLERALGDFSFFDSEKEEGNNNTSNNGWERKGGKGKEKKVYRDVVAELKAFRATEVPRWTGRLQLIMPA